MEQAVNRAGQSISQICGNDDRKLIGADIMTVEFGWPIGMPVCRPIPARSSKSGSNSKSSPRRRREKLKNILAVDGI
jgi:hypothetical protein